MNFCFEGINANAFVAIIRVAYAGSNSLANVKVQTKRWAWPPFSIPDSFSTVLEIVRLQVSNVEDEAPFGLIFSVKSIFFK